MPRGYSPFGGVVARPNAGTKWTWAVSLPYFPPLWRETRAGVEAAALFRSSVWRGGGVPDGEGRPVLLIPGFLAGDGSLATMTRWLRENGYSTRRAGMRANVGCSRGRPGAARGAPRGPGRGARRARGDHRPEPRRRLRARAGRAPAGPRERDRDARLADRPPAQRAPGRARPRAAGRRARDDPRAGHVHRALPARRLLRAFPRRSRRQLPHRRRLHRALLAHRRRRRLARLPGPGRGADRGPRLAHRDGPQRRGLRRGRPRARQVRAHRA